jgi:hypothetical protein
VFNGAIPNLAEADMVIASEAISAAQIRTIRLMCDVPLNRSDRDVRHKFPAEDFVPR